MPGPAPRNARIVLATVIEAPWGPVHLASTERGLAAIELATTAEAFAAGLERRFGGEVQWTAAHSAEPGRLRSGPAASHLGNAVAAVGAGIAGDDAGLASLTLDIDDRPAWDLAVLGAVRAIPRGETRSYGDVARIIGRPGAARAVGGAVGRNPIAYVIPCHRVIAGDGTLGGYGGGWWGDRARLLDLKESLLAREGRIVRRRPSGQEPDG